MSDDRTRASGAPGGHPGDEPAHTGDPSSPSIETALYALATRQALLAELGVLALGATSLQSLLDQAAASMRAALEVDMCTILEQLPGGESLVVRAAVGWREPLAGRIVGAGTSSHAGFTLLTSGPVIVGDIDTEARFTLPPIVREHGIRSGMGVIIPGRGGPFGVLGVQHRELRRFDREEVDYLQAAANVIALAAGRLETEEGLRRSEESFRSLIEHAPDGVLLVRGERIVYVNRALAACLGHEGTGALLGRAALDVVHPDDRAALRGQWRLMEDSGSPVPPREIRLLRRDGAVVIVESASVPVVFDGQASFAALIRDVTERKKIEARLRQSERLSSLGVLAAGVAHEINNPLMYVLGNLDLARSELARSGAGCDVAMDVAALVAGARDGGERVRRIVADLKLFSRSSGEEALSPVDLRQVIASAASIAHNEIRHRAQLVIEAGAVPRVLASDSRLGQVLLNLLLNAAHAIPEGAARANRIVVRTSTGPEGQAVIEVHDTGAGIPRENLGKLFDPFFTTKPTGVGTGLGLAICHEIVAQLGGDIAVESEPGKGTCFRITLPPAPPEPPVREPPPGVAEPPGPVPRGRVLVIDDEPFIAGLCKRTLAPEHDVEIMTGGKAALSHLEGAADLDVILCDLMMPDMSGMDLYELVERRYPRLAPRFIFFSGGAFTPAARAFRDRVSNPFLDKPVTPAALRDAVRRGVLAARSGVGHAPPVHG